jgi:hypothetical protein
VSVNGVDAGRRVPDIRNLLHVVDVTAAGNDRVDAGVTGAG